MYGCMYVCRRLHGFPALSLQDYYRMLQTPNRLSLYSPKSKHRHSGIDHHDDPHPHPPDLPIALRSPPSHAHHPHPSPSTHRSPQPHQISQIGCKINFPPIPLLLIQSLPKRDASIYGSANRRERSETKEAKLVFLSISISRFVPIKWLDKGREREKGEVWRMLLLTLTSSYYSLLLRRRGNNKHRPCMSEGDGCHSRRRYIPISPHLTS